MAMNKKIETPFKKSINQKIKEAKKAIDEFQKKKKHRKMSKSDFRYQEKANSIIMVNLK